MQSEIADVTATGIVSRFFAQRFFAWLRTQMRPYTDHQRQKLLCEKKNVHFAHCTLEHLSFLMNVGVEIKHRFHSMFIHILMRTFLSCTKLQAKYSRKIFCKDAKTASSWQTKRLLCGKFLYSSLLFNRLLLPLWSSAVAFNSWKCALVDC